MNPRIPAGYQEVGRWLRNFVLAHAKREASRIETQIDMADAREGRSYGVRLVLGIEVAPPAAPLELDYAETVEGRTRVLWCDALAQRIRTEARGLAARGPARHPA